MSGFAWHVHDGILCEPLTGDGIAERLAYIRTHKWPAEIPVLERLLKPVIGPLPAPVVEAWRAYAGAWRAYDEARRAYVEAGLAYGEARRACGEAWWAYVEAGRAYVEAGRAYDEAWRAIIEARRAYDEALIAHRDEIEALHRTECPNCPWDSRTIFPEASDAR